MFRDPPNLRSTDRPLLDGRAMIHLILEEVGVRERGTKETIFGTHTEGGTKRIGPQACIGLTTDSHQSIVILRHPFCCSAFQRGRAVSTRLLRSPVSSDCTFIPVGCSVSSRYTFPAWGLARYCLLLLLYTEQKQKSRNNRLTKLGQGQDSA